MRKQVQPPNYALQRRAAQAECYTLSMGADATWKPTTLEVSPDSFEKTVSNQELVVLHFWADWNEYEKHMDAALAELKSVYEGRVFFGSVDTDHHGHWQRCRELGILNLPALAFFVNGKHIETVIGMLPKKELSKKIEKWIIAAAE